MRPRFRRRVGRPLEQEVAQRWSILGNSQETCEAVWSGIFEMMKVSKLQACVCCPFALIPMNSLHVICASLELARLSPVYF